MKRYSAIFLLMLHVLCVSGFSPVSMKFSHINVADGLASNTVLCMFQDSDGLMWFGTNDGLTRYDTYNLKTWRTAPDVPGTIGNNSIYCIFENKAGAIWAGTERGLYIYDRKNDSFSRFQDRRGGEWIQDIHVRSIAEDKKGNIWIASLGHGLYRYDPVTMATRCWRHSDERDGGLSSDYVPTVLADDIGNIWVLTSDSYLYKYDEDSDSFIPILIKCSKTGAVMNNSFSMCFDWEGNLLIAGWDSGIFHYDKNDGTFSHYLTKRGKPYLKGRIHAINEVEPGKVLLGSDEGLTVLNMATGEFSTLSYGNMNDSGLSDDFVYGILIDREGGLWVSTYFGGVNYASPNSANFTLNKCSESSSKGRIVSKFCETEDGRIYVGTDDGGLFLYNPATGKSSSVTIDKDIPNLNIHAVLSTGEYLWVGTYSNGLYRMSLKNGSVRQYTKFSEKDQINQSVYALYRDHTGRLWIGTKTSIWYMTEEKGFTCVGQLGYNSDIIKIDGDSKGNIYFASISKGLLKYDPKAQELSGVVCSGNGVELPEGIISMCIIHDSIFIGTNGRGLFRYDIKTGCATNVTSPALDMCNLSVYHIISDDNNLWLSTNNGLVKYNLTTENATAFGKEDGLRTDIFNLNSGIKASDGSIYLGTDNGFNIFHPESLQSNIIPPNTIFLDGSAANLHDGDRILVRKGHGPLTLKFAATSYCAPRKNRYRYKLEGYEKEWTEKPYAANSVTYSSLPCGSYTFLVQSGNNDGIWGEPSRLSITVKPYWWNSVFAIILYSVICVLIVAGIVTIFIRFRMQTRKNREEKIRHTKEKTRIETELKFFTNLINELRTPVMLINAPANEIAAMPGLPKKVTENIAFIKKSSDKLLGITTEILDFRKSVSDMAMTNVHIVPATLPVIEEFKEIAEEQGIKLIFTDCTDGKAIAGMNVDAWNKIINNLLANALKFTDDLIEVSIRIVSGRICVEVYDNGTGISPKDQKNIFNAFWHYDQSARRPAQGFGLGLSITNMLAHKMGMAIKVDSEVGKWTRFTIFVPMSDKSLAEDILAREVSAADSGLPNTEHAADSDETSSYSSSIMIVDDDFDHRLYLESKLSDKYKTCLAGNGDEALEILRSGMNIDLVISDVAMPKMSGIELCKAMRKDENFAHIPVIHISSCTDAEIRMRSAKSGAEICIEKPVDISYLRLQIHNLLENRRIVYERLSKKPLLLLNLSDTINSDDKAFLMQFNDIVLANISKQDLSINTLARELHTSRSIFFQRIKDLTGETPNNLIKQIRLRKAAELLLQDQYKVNEVCYLVGFNTPSYFSKCFHSHYGMLPKEYAAQKRM